MAFNELPFAGGFYRYAYARIFDFMRGRKLPEEIARKQFMNIRSHIAYARNACLRRKHFFDFCRKRIGGMAKCFDAQGG